MEIKQLTQLVEKLKQRDVCCEVCKEDTVIGVQYICSKCNLPATSPTKEQPTYEIFKELPNLFLNQKQDSDSISTRSIDEISIKSVDLP
mgnify:FL=1